jgi:pimeloyl-ACP methyl ester carboxylesterase
MEKPIIISNKRKTKIEGVLYKMPGNLLVIVCNGFNDVCQHPTISKLVKSIHKGGFSVFTFNYASDSSGIHVQNQVDDIETILNYFNGYNKKILLGGSLGALGAAITARRHPNIAGLITINGFFGYKDLSIPLLLQYETIKLASFISKNHRLLNTFITTELAPDSIKIPALVIHGKKDKNVFPVQSERFYRKLKGNKTLKLLTDVNHGLTHSNNVEQISSVIIKWLQTLKGLI